MRLLKDAINEYGYKSYAEFARCNGVSRGHISSLVGKGVFVNDENVVVYPCGKTGATFEFKEMHDKNTTWHETVLREFGWERSYVECIEISGVGRSLFDYWLGNKLDRAKLAVHAALWRIGNE